jgi:hypothetical protein
METNKLVHIIDGKKKIKKQTLVSKTKQENACRGTNGDKLLSEKL